MASSRAIAVAMTSQSAAWPRLPEGAFVTNQSTDPNVTALEQPTTFAGLSGRVEEEIEHAYWEFDARRNGYDPFTLKQSERDAFKWALRAVFYRLRKPA